MNHALKFAALLATAAAMSATAVQAQTRFNLNCRFDVVGLSPTPAFRVSGPETLRIVVDVTQQQFCIDACDVVEALQTPAGAIRGRSGNTEFQVDRRSGEMEFLRHGLYQGAGVGVCDTAAFTGFPRRGFAGEGGAPRPRPQPVPVEPRAVAPAARGATVGERRDRAVQIGAFASVEIAQRELARVAARFPAFAEGVGRQIQPVTTSGGVTVYRTNFTGMTAARATEFCAAIRTANGDCMIRESAP